MIKNILSAITCIVFLLAISFMVAVIISFVGMCQCSPTRFNALWFGPEFSVATEWSGPAGLTGAPAYEDSTGQWWYWDNTPLHPWGWCHCREAPKAWYQSNPKAKAICENRELHLKAEK